MAFDDIEVDVQHVRIGFGLETEFINFASLHQRHRSRPDFVLTPSNSIPAESGLEVVNCMIRQWRMGVDA